MCSEFRRAAPEIQGATTERTKPVREGGATPEVGMPPQGRRGTYGQDRPLIYWLASDSASRTAWSDGASNVVVGRPNHHRPATAADPRCGQHRRHVPHRAARRGQRPDLQVVEPEGEYVQADQGEWRADAAATPNPRPWRGRTGPRRPPGSAPATRRGRVHHGNPRRYRPPHSHPPSASTGRLTGAAAITAQAAWRPAVPPPGRQPERPVRRAPPAR